MPCVTRFPWEEMRNPSLHCRGDRRGPLQGDPIGPPSPDKEATFETLVAKDIGVLQKIWNQRDRRTIGFTRRGKACRARHSPQVI